MRSGTTVGAIDLGLALCPAHEPAKPQHYRGANVLSRLGSALLLTLAVVAFAPLECAAGNVRHGSEIDRRRVGPSTIGAAARPVGRVAAISFQHAHSFATHVGKSARYDGFDVDGPHVLIEGVALIGPLEITGPETIVLRGVRITAAGSAHAIVHSHPGAGRLYVLWSEFGSAADSRRDGQRSDPRLDRGLYLRSDNVTVYRSHVSGTADGIQIHGRNVRIIESLVDGLVHWPGQHNDGIQMLGQSADVEVLRSRIDNAHPQTSCIIAAGPRIRIADNHLTGGGWIIYGGARGRNHAAGAARDVVVTGNIFSRQRYPKGGSFGPVTDWSHDPSHRFVWRANRYDNGAPIEFGTR